MNTAIKHNLKQEARKLRQDYNELRAEIDALLQQNNKKAQHRIIGAFTTAGAMTEKILLWIIRKEGRESQLQNIESKQLGLFEYKKIITGIIPRQQIIHISTIGQWRNHVAHANDLEDIDEHEITSVNSALKSFVEWFFEDYIGNSLNEDDVDTEVKSKSNFTNANATDSLNSSQKIDRPILKLISRLAMVSICLILGYWAYDFFLASKPEKPQEKRVAKKEMNKESVYNLLIDYFASLSDKNFDANNYFAKHVTQYILEKDLDPTKINVLRQLNTEYIDAKNSIDKNSLYWAEKKDGVTYWRFWNNFSCYRTSKRKFESCKVLMEFGLNTDEKITSIKELQLIGLKFSKKKPI